MSLDFSKVTSWRVPEGEVSEVTDAQGNILWSIIEKKYVSLGDSIAAGHTINSDWEKSPLDVNKGYYEGTKSQYTETLDGASQPNQKTIIVNNSYTDRINKDLKTKYGTPKVYTLSFAHSGDTVANLISKLNHTRVQDAIRKADIVTICIGANDILGAASEEAVSDYISSGSLTGLENAIETNLNLLDTDSSPNSYINLFKKLAEEINPNVKYIFTTVYNPYKYLWIEEGKNGFFAPLLGTIPDMNIIGLDIDGLIKDELLNTTIVQRLFERVNNLGVWVEKYITRLNTILKNKINSYRSINPNFTIADTKSLFDVFPDRPENAQWHYNDLVNVEYTKGYNTATMDWGRLYEESGGASNFWWNLSYKYISAGFDINGFATDLVNQMIEKVIVPDLDPHPETYGQYVLSRSFEDVIGLSSLDRYTIKYNPNGGDGSMSDRVIHSVDGLPAYNVTLDPLGFTPQTGYRFTGWLGSDGKTYSNSQVITLTSDLTLTAQWSNIYTLTVRQKDSSVMGVNLSKATVSVPFIGEIDISLGNNYDDRRLLIDGQQQALNTFSDRGTTVQTFNVQYGKQFAINARSKNPYDAVYNDWTCWIKDSEGTKYAEHKSIAGVVTMPANDVTVEFEFKSAGSWASFNAQVCWDVTVYNTKNITGIDNFTW